GPARTGNEERPGYFAGSAERQFTQRTCVRINMANQKFATYFLPSFPPPIQAFGGRLQRESIGFENKWIPARARLRGLGRNDGNLCSELAKRHTNRRPSRQLGWSI